jgi:Ser/Thr protein kinase RdoA (MazF antagonist)
VVLDPDAFAALVQSRLPGAAVQSIQEGYVHYKPGNSCLGTYHVRVNEQPVTAYVRCYARSDRAKFEKHAALPQVNGPLGPGRIHWRDLGLVLSFFPNDVRVPVLQRLANQDRRRDLLRRVFRGRLDLGDARVVPLGYKPERRFVAALVDREIERAVVKFYNAATFAPHKAKLFHSGDVLRVASRLGRSKRHRAIAFQWLPGRLLREELMQGRATSDDLFRLGVALAELHHQTIDAGSLPHVTFESLAKRARMLARFVSCVHPAAASRANKLAQRIIEGLSTHSLSLRPLHGDLNEKQVLLHEETVALVDFDESAFGDPAVDLGNFLAYSYYDDGENSARMPPSKVYDAFLRGYGERGDFIEPERLDLFLAMALLRIAPRGFRTRDPLWPQRLESALDKAESLLAGKRPLQSAAGR